MSEEGLADKVPLPSPSVGSRPRLAGQLKGRRLEAHFALALVISEAESAAQAVDIVGR